MSSEQRDFFIEEAEKISDLHNVFYLNYYKDNQFTDLDYYDSCHLNELGAEKLTQKIYNFINKDYKNSLNELDLNLDLRIRVGENLPWYAAILGGLPAVASSAVINKVFEGLLPS